MRPTIYSDSTVSGPSSGRRLQILCGALIGALLLAGAAALAASFVPFRVLLDRVRSVSDSGQGTFFSPEYYHAMQTRLRLIAIANLAAGIILLRLRRPILGWAQRIFSDSQILARDFRAAASSLPAIDRLTLAGLTFFAAILRIPFLYQPMRYDEAITFLEYASRPFYVALSFYSTPNNHVFHTLLVRLAYLGFGNHPWALRLPTFFAGLCLVPATYAAARSLYRKSGALLAAALVASSSILIEYSTNARGYGMVCLLFMMLIPPGAYALRHRNWAAWLLLAIVAALGFFTIPIMLYPFGGVVAWLLLSAVIGNANQDAHQHAQPDKNGDSQEDNRGDNKEDAQPDLRSAVSGLFAVCVLTVFLAGELYSPVLAVSGPTALFANKWVAASHFSVLLSGLPASLASTWRQWNRDLPAWLAAALAAAFAISLLWHRRCGRQRVPLALALLLWTAPVVLAQRVIPFERVWLFALPLYFIGAAAGLAVALEAVPGRHGGLWRGRLHSRHAIAVIAVVLAVFAGVRSDRGVESNGAAHRSSIYSSRIYLSKIYLSEIYLSNESRGMPALAAWLKGQLRSGDVIVAVPPSDGPLRYYLQHEGVPIPFPADYNGSGPRRRFVVVNETWGDTVPQVCEAARQPHQQNWDARLAVQFESAALYEVPFVPQDH
ncbi:MAG TPA: glycosyltransferase family 39 protein [Candidatus Sulfotelmatobacter sp.]|nr:glycosyltransferase family 39 protein [Candidatus Sulfotelmatobacter sp.]